MTCVGVWMLGCLTVPILVSSVGLLLGLPEEVFKH